MVVTWPGPMTPSSATAPESRMARVAGGVILWVLKTKKFSIPSAFALSTAEATIGAVVSKPTPRKITGCSGFWRAIFSASSGE